MVLKDLDIIEKESLEKLERISSLNELEEFRLEYLGKKGKINQILKRIKEIPPEKKADFGKKANQIKEKIQIIFNKKKNALLEKSINQSLQKEWLDPTFPVKKTRGHLHPITAMIIQLEEIFRGMGFVLLEGPHIEDDYHNFTALNTPEDHPARDMHDTFWLEDGYLLRTHTSCVQIRAMERYSPPLRIIAPGRVYRYEAIDASHESTFYQLEGLMIDRDVSVAHLIYVMKVMLEGIFNTDVEVRLRPGYFPFVEPGFELDMKCLLCKGQGCSVCKNVGWLEMLGCGLVHPNVLRICKINPDKWSGFAFGVGINRLVMMKYGINDIRYFMSGDIRFIRQF